MRVQWSNNPYKHGQYNPAINPQVIAVHLSDLQTQLFAALLLTNIVDKPATAFIHLQQV